MPVQEYDIPDGGGGFASTCRSEGEAVSAQRLAALAGVALDLVGAETVHDLTQVITDSGLAALGANGGAIAVIHEQA